MSMKIAIASGKGGVGKSMLCSCLCMLFSKKIVAVDCDVDAPNLAVWLSETGNWGKKIPVSTSLRSVFDLKKCNSCGLCAQNCRFGAITMKEKPKLNPFLCEGCSACKVICPQGAIRMKKVQNGEIRVKKTKYGFSLLSGHLFPGETGSGKIVSEIKEEASKLSYDLMLIDSAPGTGCPVIASLQGVDFVVLVTEPTLSGFSDLKRVLETVNHFNIPYGVVVNKWDIYKEKSKEIEKWAGDRFLGKISYDKGVFKTISELKPVLGSGLKIEKEIRQVFDNLPLKLSI